MLLFIRYTKGLGDAAIYTRLRNATGQFWDFISLIWSDALIDDCKVFLLESIYTDDDSIDALYSASASIPAGGPWVEETVLVSTGKVIGYDNTAGVVDSETLNIKQSLFSYVGNASNIFSKVCGSFTGTINFFACSYSEFAANMNDPGGLFICKVNSVGQMLDENDVVYGTSALPAANGEVLYFQLSSSPTLFNCLAYTAINIYNAINFGNVRIYVPLGIQHVDLIGSYYPTTAGGILIYENGNLMQLGETAYGRSLAMIPSINFDRISQPVQLTTTAVIT